MTTALRISAFTESERGKLIQPESPLIDWHPTGTTLSSTVTIAGHTYRLECETIASLDSETIEQSSAWIYDGDRLVLPEAEPGLYRVVRESADEAVDRYAVALLAAWADERGEQAVEEAMFEEAGMR